MSKPVQSLLFSLVVSLVGLAVVGYIAVGQWLAPLLPIKLTLAGVMLPVLAFGVIIAMPKEGEKWMPLELAAGTVPGVILGGVAIFIGGLWAKPATRISALDEVVQSGDRRPLERALSDPAPSVVSRACYRLLERGLGHDRSKLLDALEGKPAAATCLKKGHDFDDAPDVARTLADRWSEHLASSAPADDEDVCALPRALWGLPLGHDVTLPMELTCAFHARADGYGSCCTQVVAESLGAGKQLASQMSTMSDALVEASMAPGIFSASFGTGLDGARAKRDAGKLALGDPVSRRVVLGMTCDAVDRQDRARGAIRQLRAQTQTCGLDSAQAPAGLADWRALCADMRSRLEADEKAHPTKVLCDIARTFSTRHAIAAASRIINSTVSGRHRGAMSGSIVLGAARRDQQESGTLGRLNEIREKLKSNPHMTDAQREMLQQIDGLRGGLDGTEYHGSQELRNALTGAGKKGERVGVDPEQQKGLEEALKKMQEGVDVNRRPSQFTGH